MWSSCRSQLAVLPGTFSIHPLRPIEQCLGRISLPPIDSIEPRLAPIIIFVFLVRSRAIYKYDKALTGGLDEPFADAVFD